MQNIFETLDKNYIKFENYTIHVIIDKNDKLWFHANQLAEALGYANPRDIIKKYTDTNDRKQLKDINHILIIKGQPMTNYLTEAGLYKLVLSSTMPKAKKFSNWVTNDVLPAIRKYGYYKIKKQNEDERTDLINKINYLQKINSIMQNELKKNKFPNGGVVYAIDFSNDSQEIYKIGMTGDMKIRKKLYDTHSLYNKNIAYMKEIKCPIKLEYCVRGMLYEYRFKDKKDFYVCSLSVVKKAFKTCQKSINCMEQNGGGISFDNIINKLKNKTIILNNKINILENNILV